MDDLGTKKLESKRLILRKFTLEDTEAMYNSWATDEETCKYLSWTVHKNMEETKNIIQSWIDKYEEDNYNWIVELKDTHEVIGSICGVGVNRKHNSIELGYCYCSRFWGNGYATEALRTVIEYLLNECNFYLVEARHISGNPASGKVMEKAGMHKDGVLRDRRINKHTKERNDLIVYSIKKDEL